MPKYIHYIVIFTLLFLIELLYFRIAYKYNIIDRPNHRSSHFSSTIRGGGIVFPLGVLIWLMYSGLNFPFFVFGLILISTISFIDDIKHLRSGIRSCFQVFAVGLLLLQVRLEVDWYYYPLVLILIVGAKNAYNFMDGINGITGLYSLITLLTLLYINHFVVDFTSGSLILITCLALLVFNFFNFREKAKCFAGDVGSVGIAFIILFMLIQLLAETKNFIYVSLLLVYGLDTASTIFFRFVRRENIFKAHRSHFYQFLANEKKWSHLVVSFLYSSFQLLVNIFILAVLPEMGYSNNISFLFFLLVFSAILFVLLRFTVEGSGRLLKKVAV